jgi:hypothetical protein
MPDAALSKIVVLEDAGNRRCTVNGSLNLPVLQAIPEKETSWLKHILSRLSGLRAAAAADVFRAGTRSIWPRR